MNLLFKDVTVLTETGKSTPHAYVTVCGSHIASISQKEPQGTFDRVIDGTDKILMPAFYNTHAHAPMTLFRGYGEDMPLDRWLNDCIFPAEDKLYNEAVYAGSLVACAEMLRCGTVSFSDMYFFCDQIVRAVHDIGMKANISRSISCFDDTTTKETDYRFREAQELHKAFHNTDDGRIKIDMAIHSEYTMKPGPCAYVADYAYENGLVLQVHMSETEKEHEECIGRHGKTPCRFFYDLGCFRPKTVAAHCVWVTEEDMDIMHECGVIAAHNPVSNLKLGSGIMHASRLKEKGIHISLGTDGAASNNSLDMMREMNFAALLQKGRDRVCDSMKTPDFINMATREGALAQDRPDCGIMQEGARADLVLLDLADIGCVPVYDPACTVLYSASSRNVKMTVCDGEILYEDGTFRNIDVEKARRDLAQIVSGYFTRA